MQPFLVHCVLTLGLITCSSAYAVDPLKESNGAARGNAVNDEEESAPRIEFLSGAPGQAAILDDSLDNFFGRLRKREIAAMTASPADGKSDDEAREFARAFFAGAVLDFADEEREAIQWIAREVQRRMAPSYPFFSQQPWCFLKVRADLCGSFSFTRGRCIVLSERTYHRLVEAWARDQTEALRRFGPLLVHEQLHVLQRFFPQRFQPLYEDVFGFRRARVAVHDGIDRRQVSNPDGLDEDWIVAIKPTEGVAEDYWLCTVLTNDHPVPRMGRDFQGIAVRVKASANGGYEMLLDRTNQPVCRRLDECEEYLTRFPIRSGHDHPNEIAAYLFTEAIAPLIAGVRDAVPSASTEIVVKSREWFRERL